MNTFTQQLLDVLKNLDKEKFKEYFEMLDEFGEDEETFREFEEVVLVKRKELTEDDDLLGKVCLYYLGKSHGKGETDAT